MFLSLVQFSAEEVSNISYVDWLGYVACFLVVVSFTFKSNRILRFINSLGCILFIIYGVFIGSMPVILTNVIITGINLIYLFFVKSKSKKSDSHKHKEEKKEEEFLTETVVSE